MSLLLLPTELTDEICLRLAAFEVFSLVQANRQFHARFVRNLYRIAIEFRSHRNKKDELTSGLEEVSFWFDKGGRGSVLEWSIFHNRAHAFDQLVQLPQMDLLQKDSWNTTLLHRIAGKGLVRYMRPLIEQLRLTGQDPFQTDRSLLTPLHYAAGRGMREAVKVLITMGARVAATDYHGNTPLHLAAVTGSHLVLDLLVDAGVNIDSQSSWGWTAIDQASICRQTKTVEVLEKLGSGAPTWQRKPEPIGEFLKLSPCPPECFTRFYRNHGERFEG